MIELYVKRDKTAAEEEGVRGWMCKSEQSRAKKRTGFQAPVRIRCGLPNAIATTPPTPSSIIRSTLQPSTTLLRISIQLPAAQETGPNASLATCGC